MSGLTLLVKSTHVLRCMLQRMRRVPQARLQDLCLLLVVALGARAPCRGLGGAQWLQYCMVALMPPVCTWRLSYGTWWRDVPPL